MSDCDVVYTPIRFLNATVLSFNTSLGLGGSESTLNVDLIEDCENDPPDNFLPGLPENDPNHVEVGAPVYFSTAIDGSGFNFGGVLSSWTVNQGGSGKTFNVKVVDPRQLLENTIVVVDTYLGSPIQATNYFNVYAGYESSVLNGNCSVFGDADSSERGMAYSNIISKLTQMNPTICSPTGYQFTIDFSSFPQNVPSYYRVTGPGITLLQLLQDVCDVLGLEFYTNLIPGNIIKIGTISLANPPENYNTILETVATFDGRATEISYGQELRNEKTKVLILGEKQHYLTYVNNFDYFFGEDLVNNEMVPVVPFAHNKSGFWIKKNVEKLNASLFRPLVGGNGPFTISELDIRTALSSFETWMLRALDPQSKGTFNEAIRNTYVECNQQVKEALNNVMTDNKLDAMNRYKKICDIYNNPTKGGAEAGKPKPLMDLEAIHQFVQNLGSTYYGKQWIAKLNQTVCYHQGENFQEKIFSDVPTGDGGWVDGDVSVLGLSEPELTFFRSDDNRINCFAVFNTDGTAEAPENNKYGEDSSQSQSSTSESSS